MPHLVLYYTANLDAETDMSTLCRTLADAMLGVRDEAGKAVFPTGGVRVLGYPAPVWVPVARPAATPAITLSST